jgi:predicted metal-dependent phosphoesterase TrpH
MKEQKLIKADVHLHTCLSPCADIIQSPARVVKKANECGLNLLFITDHNSIANAEAAINAAKSYNGMKVYPGMEITTKEEVHLLSFFENLDDAGSTQDYLNGFLPDVYFEKEKEDQIIANEYDEVEGFYGKSLFSAVDMSLDEIIDLVHKNNGLAVAAHIDRQSFSVMSQLGFIPPECNLDALEISPNLSLERAKEIFREYAGKFKFVQGSDSHSLNTIGSVRTEYYGKDNTFEGFREFLNE